MWGWLSKLRQFVSTATGKVIGRRASRTITQINTIVGEDIAANLASDVANDRLTLPAWEAAMRGQIKNNYLQQYLLGLGGKGQMTFVDYGSVGGMLKEQYGHLSKFAREIAGGNLTEGQIAARAKMYIRSAREANQRANMRAWGVPSLPAYPGDVA